MSVYKLGFISLCFERFTKRKSLVTYSFSLWPLLSFLLLSLFAAAKMKLQMENRSQRNWPFPALNTRAEAQAATAAAAAAAMAKNERLLSLLLSFVHTKCLLDSGSQGLSDVYWNNKCWMSSTFWFKWLCAFFRRCCC